MWIVLAVLPFSVIEHPVLRTVFRMLRPEVALFGRETVRMDLQRHLDMKRVAWAHYFQVNNCICHYRVQWFTDCVMSPI